MCSFLGAGSSQIQHKLMQQNSQELIVTLVRPEILLCPTSPTQRGHNNRPLKRLTTHCSVLLGNAIPGLIPGLHRARLWLAIAGLVIGKIATRYRAVKLHVSSLAYGSF